ncbi:MAG TPA: hypothetical protein VFR04_04775 [Solirubrobacterales bacterium]|nr:hypothetical protein [Solirubrobacterales bacterium]
MRKAIPLAMAAAVVAMFAAPGPAPAAWTKHHADATANFELEITGTDMRFDANFGSVTCKTTLSKVLFEVGTTGKIKSLAPEGNVTAECQGAGLVAQCDVHEAAADGLPWTIHTATADTVTMTTGTMTFTLSGFFCSHTVQLTPDTLTMTVASGETGTTSTAVLNGEPDVDGVGQEEVEVFGTVHVLGTITYGI